MADELVGQKLRRDLDEATRQHMPVMVVQTSYISDMICRTAFDAAEIARLKAELVDARGKAVADVAAWLRERSTNEDSLSLYLCLDEAATALETGEWERD